MAPSPYLSVSVRRAQPPEDVAADLDAKAGPRHHLHLPSRLSVSTFRRERLSARALARCRVGSRYLSNFLISRTTPRSSGTRFSLKPATMFAMMAAAAFAAGPSGLNSSTDGDNTGFISLSGICQILPTPRAIPWDRLELGPTRDIRVVMLVMHDAEDEVAPRAMDGVDWVDVPYRDHLVCVHQLAWLPLLVRRGRTARRAIDRPCELNTRHRGPPPRTPGTSTSRAGTPRRSRRARRPAGHRAPAHGIRTLST